MVQQLRSFLRQVVPALVAVVVFTVVCGVVYPLVVTGVAQAAFPDKADGSLVEVDGTVVGSSLLGQQFSGAEYFHPRPSSAGAGYDGTASGASNLGPTNEEYLAEVADRVAGYRKENGLPPEVPVPADARLQAPRVADARDMALDEVLRLVDDHTQDRPLGILGDPGVNVLELNLALDRAG